MLSATMEEAVDQRGSRVLMARALDWELGGLGSLPMAAADLLSDLGRVTYPVSFPSLG